MASVEEREHSRWYTGVAHESVTIALPFLIVPNSCTRVLLTTLRNNSFLRPKAIVSILTRNVDYCRWHPLYSLCALRLVVRAGRGSWRVRSRSKTDQGVSSSNSSRLTPGCETPKAKRTYL